MSAIRKTLSPQLDDSVPSLHRDEVKQGAKLIDDAARVIGQVRHCYRPDAPEVEELLTALLRLDQALFELDGWLSHHPARRA